MKSLLIFLKAQPQNGQPQQQQEFHQDLKAPEQPMPNHPNAV